MFMMVFFDGLKGDLFAIRDGHKICIIKYTPVSKPYILLLLKLRLDESRENLQVQKRNKKRRYQ